MAEHTICHANDVVLLQRGAHGLRQIRSTADAGVSATTQMAYDAAGNAIRVTDALGRVTETQYDERNRAVAAYAPPVWDALTSAFVRPSTQTSYDALGQVLTVTDPQGNVTAKLYDRAGRNWKVIAPAVDGVTPTTLTTFDPGGLALSVTNPLSQTVTNTYDTHGHLISTTDAAGITNSFSYDAAGNRTSVTDGKGQTTAFVYDGLNRLTSQTFANGDTTSYTYNAVQKIAQTSPRGIVTSYGYDARDRLLTVSAPAHGDTRALGRSYTYDSAGHLLTVNETGNAAANVSYTYDAMGRVTAESSRGIVHQYRYDIAGNRTQATYGTGRSVQTSYDALNRPESIVEGGRATRYGYDLGGRAVVLIAGNGQTSQNSYDALGRLKDRTLFKTPAMSTVLAEFEWQHDALGNVTAQHETWPGDGTRSTGIRSTVMTYDADNRLLSETIQTRSSGGAPAVDQSVTSYTYDAANNRATKTVTRIAASSTEAGENDVGHWIYTYNTANQLTGWNKWDYPSGSLQKTASFTYDEAGNRTAQSQSTINSQSSTTLYAWDAQDRLASVTMPDGKVHGYDYDYRTRRTGTTESVAGAVTKQTAIVFAGGLSLAEYEGVTGSLPVSPTVEYTRGPDMGGGVGGMLYSLRGGTAKYSLSNGRGDIVAQADQGASLTWTASYEAYGKRTKETGTNQDKQRANSKDEDPTGLLNEGFRYRDIETGVWLSRDPAGFVDGPNLYAYVRQNPWTKFDPLGLEEAGGEAWCDNPPCPLARAVGRAVYGGLRWFKNVVLDGDRNHEAFDIVPGVTNVEHAWKGTTPQLPDLTTTDGRADAVVAVGALALSTKVALSKPTAPTSSGSKVQAVNQAIVEAEVPPPSGVKPYEVDTYSNLNKRALAGDGLDHDHIPSFGSLVEQFKTQYGRPPTPAEAAKIKAQGTAAAVPAESHRQGPTYGGKNILQLRQADAAAPQAAAERDTAAMVKNAPPEHAEAAAKAAEKVKERAR